MTLLENWRNLAYGDGLDDKKKEQLWNGYFTIEKGIYEQILANPTEVVEGTVKELAEKYQVSSARLCLRFALQKGVIPLPKASAMERMKENQDIFSFNIEETDMYRLETMPQTGWSGEHPDRVRMVLN